MDEQPQHAREDSSRIGDEEPAILTVDLSEEGLNLQESLAVQKKIFAQQRRSPTSEAIISLRSEIDQYTQVNRELQNEVRYHQQKFRHLSRQKRSIEDALK